MASIRKRNGRWVAEVVRKGYPRKAASFDTKAQAQAWAAQIEADMASGRTVGAALRSKTMYDLLERYRDEVATTRKGMRWEMVRCNYLIKNLPWVGKSLGAITSSDIAQWRDMRLAGQPPLRPVLGKTVRREMALLRAIFKVAVNEFSWMTVNPVLGVTLPQEGPPRTQRVREDVALAIAYKMGFREGVPPVNMIQRAAILVLVAREIGMRRGELAALLPEDCFLDQHYVRVADSKNGTSRLVPLTERAEELMRLLPTGPIEGVKPHTVFNVTPDWATTSFGRARKAVSKTMPEARKVRLHDGRRESMTTLSKKMGPMELAKVGGYKNLKTMFEVYYQPDIEDLVGKMRS